MAKTLSQKLPKTTKRLKAVDEFLSFVLCIIMCVFVLGFTFYIGRWSDPSRVVHDYGNGLGLHADAWAEGYSATSL